MEQVKLTKLSELAKKVLQAIALVESNRATVVALEGDLGAGKTTFVQALAKELEVKEIIQSPTYVLMKSYEIDFLGFTTLVHIDAYRLKNAAEFAALKPETFLQDKEALVVIEWPERVQGALPKPDLVIKFSSENAGTEERYIEVV